MTEDEKLDALLSMSYRPTRYGLPIRDSYVLEMALQEWREYLEPRLRISRAGHLAMRLRHERSLREDTGE
jgi:hypothetical protein